MRARGFTLIELMIALVISSCVALGVVTLIANTARDSMQQTNQATASLDARQIFHLLTDMIRMAEICAVCGQTLDITYPGGAVINPNPDKAQTQTNDSIRMDFTIPTGYKVWPNVLSPYAQNAVRLEWSNSTGRVTVASATSKAGLNAASVTDMVSLSPNASRVMNIDVWPLDAVGNRQPLATSKALSGYEVCVVVRPPRQDSTYSNPEDTGILLHYRTAEVCGTIISRN